MNYALIENGVVTNIIWLYETNSDEFPTAVKLGERQVEIGDTYEDGRFYRDGAEVLTAEEAAVQAAALYAEALQTLGVDISEPVEESAVEASPV